MDQDQSQQKRVPAVERATAVLDVVAASRRYLTISELARETGLPKSTVHSLCMTMVQLDMLIRRPDQTYILGPHVLRWANAFERQTDVAAEFAAVWDQTEIAPEAMVSLSVPEGGEVVFIAARQSEAGQRVQIRPGMRLPAPFVAAGRAVLSRRADFEIRRLFADGLPEPLTERSPRGLDALLDVVGEARARGYALDEEECQPGISSLAAPVLDARNQPMAAVMISLPSALLDAAARETLAGTIVTIAERLSRRMGADPSPRT